MPGKSDSPEVTLKDIGGAERLAGVGYTDEERALIRLTVAAQIERNLQRRRYRFAPDMAPALAFRPDMPKSASPAPAGGLICPSHAPPPLPWRDEDLAFAPVSALGEWLRTRQITSSQLTEIYLERLERIGPELACVVTLTADLARAQAAAADREIAAGSYRGPLHGIPWGAKDILDTRGIRTTWGAEPFRDRVPDDDAAVVKLLADAGAVLVAKLSTGALAYGDIWFGGQTRNPWHPEQGSGGSSAGSAAAVAAGLVGFAIGSETNGSITQPCRRCGTTGLRPSFGRVPRTGAMALCWSLDKLGPICRSVEDTALVFAAINADDAGDPGSRPVALDLDLAQPLAGRRIGYVPAWFVGDDASDLDREMLAAARRIGAELVPIALPDLPFDSLMTILHAEAAAAFEDLTLEDRDDLLTRQDAMAWPNLFRQARFISAVDLIQADRLRRRAMVVLASLFREVDAVIAPGLTGPMHLVTNFTGHPALTLRAGFQETDDGGGRRATLPDALSIWTNIDQEGLLCALGLAFEAQFSVKERRPTVS